MKKQPSSRPEDKCLICSRQSKLHFVESFKKYSIYSCSLCKGQFAIPMQAGDYGSLYRPGGGGDFTYKNHVALKPDAYVSIYAASPFIRIVLSFLKKYNPKGRLLDIGCSQGAFARLVSDMGFEVFGIDPSSEAIKYARENYSLSNTFVSTIDDIPAGLADFDLVAALEVIEHLERPASLLRKSFQLLKPGGRLILTIPNNESLEVKFGRRPSVDYPPNHLSRYSKQTIRCLLEYSGFDSVAIHTSPIGRWTIGNIIAPGIIRQLSCEGGMDMSVCLEEDRSKGPRVLNLLRLKPLLGLSRLMGDIISFLVKIFFPVQGDHIVAIARKPPLESKI
ncbi:MAG: methyltransferase domain-containing protein [Candidatus Omnitrophica bacterium]|nr:methyltransferase domain-containing protein [Candidatus Omnitrophota bacterium]